MANHLKMATVQAILALRQSGWSYRRIARELGIHRETVAGHVRLAETRAKPAISITGSAGRRSKCEPYRTIILTCLDQGLSAQRIWQDLQAEHDCATGHSSARWTDGGALHIEQLLIDSGYLPAVCNAVAVTLGQASVRWQVAGVAG